MEIRIRIIAHSHGLQTAQSVSPRSRGHNQNIISRQKRRRDSEIMSDVCTPAPGDKEKKEESERETENETGVWS